ncbi:glycine betaine ABC transporter substrate-binding protein [Pontibaca salina]|uniref:Glycine/betaine ABC transporter substrate-binding protein n=1 Tax=Pontibaca salina TaxID=2795731 RepID=A0A934M140_9RHOB|nr:glycine betaine ABC transporter substrate-binding protein [Pontibaca salina]MBI6630388.1 glycine/betaine ABC transporter substrate-binding protein [Pontibaca salina]
MKTASLGVFGFLAVMAMPGEAKAECGEVSITEMNWASAAIVTQLAKFLMEQGYGCTVTVVPSDPTPAMVSVAENNEPHIITELWLNGVGDIYDRLKDEGKLDELAPVLDPGGVEGWWVPTYLAEKHPELKSIDGVLANPELVGGIFNNCPDGFGCRIRNDNLVRAVDMEGHGLKVFNHGSGETLATSIASAYENQEAWFGYYWGPTEVMGKYDMTRVSLGKYHTEIDRANQNANNADPQISEFPDAPVYTVVTTDFREREPEVAEMMSNFTIETDTMSALLGWKSENSASIEETVVRFIQDHSNAWSSWVSDEARQNLGRFID